MFESFKDLQFSGYLINVIASIDKVFGYFTILCMSAYETNIKLQKNLLRATF